MKRAYLAVLWVLASLFITICALPSPAGAERVRMITNLGNIDIELFEDLAPLTVANFLAYAREGAYTNSVFHRQEPGFVIQAGGYFLNGNTIYPVAKKAPIVNEFHLSNLRGTIAMAKVAGNPDSATSEWFFNLADNSANLDLQNGGFTVFGRVTDESLSVLDAIGTLNRYDASGILGSAFNHLPLLEARLAPDTLVLVKNVVNLSDALRALEAMAGMAVQPAVSRPEIDGDGRMGMAEVIHVLQRMGPTR